jgi:hypothetical protein
VDPPDQAIVPLLRRDGDGLLDATTVLDELMQGWPERYHLGHLRRQSTIGSTAHGARGRTTDLAENEQKFSGSAALAPRRVSWSAAPQLDASRSASGSWVASAGPILAFSGGSLPVKLGRLYVSSSWS